MSAMRVEIVHCNLLEAQFGVETFFCDVPNQI